MFKAKISVKIYLLAAFLLGIFAFGWYGISFLNSNEILIKNDEPMDYSTKAVITLILALVIASWALSLFVLIRQIILGYAFAVDESGIHRILIPRMVGAFIFILPIKKIPYQAIEQIFEKEEQLFIKIDKSKIAIFPIFKSLVPKEICFNSAFAQDKPQQIKEAIDTFMNKCI